MRSHLGEAVRVLSEALTEEFHRPFVLPMWLPTPGMRRKRRALRTIDDLIWGLIRGRRASGEDAGDLLSRLLLAVDVDGDGGRMTDRQARDEAVTLFMAGHDTTAAALAWIWACVARHPEVEARLVEEVKRVLGPRPATFGDLSRLTYTGCVVRETLRLYPPTIALLPRETTDGIALGGYRGAAWRLALPVPLADTPGRAILSRSPPIRSRSLVDARPPHLTRPALDCCYGRLDASR